MPKFEVVSEYQPAGDQPEAIAALAAGIENGLDEQTLLGVTGSGKTFTMAKVIEAVQRPTLVLAHNKTLAAQLCAEFKEFFPHNAVEYFTSRRSIREAVAASRSRSISSFTAESFSIKVSVWGI